MASACEISQIRKTSATSVAIQTVEVCVRFHIGPKAACANAPVFLRSHKVIPLHTNHTITSGAPPCLSYTITTGSAT